LEELLSCIADSAVKLDSKKHYQQQSHQQQKLSEESFQQDKQKVSI